VQEAIEKGFPTDLEQREAFFMNSIAEGEQLAGEGVSILLMWMRARACVRGLC
jgi:hypothetical protein